MSLAALRREYALAGLRRADLLPDPIRLFEKWFTEAAVASVNEPNAVTLATANKAGHPSSRTVLLKHVDARGFAVFTNYESHKGRDLAENPHASITAYWREVERQVCICGSVTRLSREESEKYFKSRPVGSQLAAWVSKQGQVIPNREFLENSLAEVKAKYGDDVPLPPYWGGFLLTPITIEFWQGRPSRLHDRFIYTRQTNNTWQIDRLSP